MMFYDFGFFEACFFMVFLLIAAVILITIFKGIGTWHKNNNSPRLNVRATVVAKRGDIHHHHHNSGMNDGVSHTTTSTTYYVTFQFESGDRLELHVEGSEYGVLLEGDTGMLTFQGTRYLGFQRD